MSAPPGRCPLRRSRCRRVQESVQVSGARRDRRRRGVPAVPRGSWCGSDSNSSAVPRVCAILEHGCANSRSARTCTDTDGRLIFKMSHAARAIRLDTHRVRIGSADGILLNLSASGALVRLPRFVQVAADATLSLLADDHWLDVPCRVVRCTETPVEMAGATWRRK